MRPLLTLSLLLLFAWTLAGQNIIFDDVSEDDLLQPSDLLRLELEAQHGNYAKIKQKGDDNEASIDQVLVGGSYNAAKIRQVGHGHKAFVRQVGADNQLYIRQKGSGNYYDLDNLADDNEIFIIQNGRDNRIIQELNNSNNLNIELIQRGNNNEIIQQLDGINSHNIKVRQQGDNLRLVIRQSAN